MLKGISPLISPEMLKVLAEMGHGDDLVIANAHFPAHTFHENVIRADGQLIAPLLNAILPLFEIDSYVDDPIIMMEPIAGDILNPNIEEAYISSIKEYAPDVPGIVKVDRFKFYDRVKNAFAVILTSEVEKFSHIILKKGVSAC